MPRRTIRQAGFTLIELIVVVFLLGAIGAISLAAFSSGSQSLGRVDDDIRGQQDLRIVTERLTRDIRGARGVDEDSDASTLKIWIDSDADYVADSSEIIVWDVFGTAPDLEVRRTVGSDPPQIVGRAVIDAFAFQYFQNVAGTPTPLVPDLDPLTANPVVTTAQIVEVSMDYDAIVGAYLGQKTNTYRIRLRNAE